MSKVIVVDASTTKKEDLVLFQEADLDTIDLESNTELVGFIEDFFGWDSFLLKDGILYMTDRNCGMDMELIQRPLTYDQAVDIVKTLGTWSLENKTDYM